MRCVTASFVSLGPCIGLGQSSSCKVTFATCSRRPTAIASRNRRQWRMSADKPASEDIPPEPYPGFYSDMRRAGISDDQARQQAMKAQAQKNPQDNPASKIGGKKSLVGPDGKPLAPWMNVSETYNKTPVRSRSDAKGRLAGDPQRQELSGQGLVWRMLGDELELRWATGSEEGNKGFIVTRRQGKTQTWENVSTWRDKPAELASKSSEGGSYSFIVSDTSPGSWVYRISDEDGAGNVSDLSQTLVEIESGEDSKVRFVALGVLLVVLFGFLAFSLIADPLSGTS